MKLAPTRSTRPLLEQLNEQAKGSRWQVGCDEQRRASRARPRNSPPQLALAGGVAVAPSIAGNVNKLTLFSTTIARSAPSDCAPSDASGTETTGHGDPYRRRIASSRNRSRIKG